MISESASQKPVVFIVREARTEGLICPSCSMQFMNPECPASSQRELSNLVSFVIRRVPETLRFPTTFSPSSVRLRIQPSTLDAVQQRFIKEGGQARVHGSPPLEEKMDGRTSDDGTSRRLSR